ncbi:MAG: exodeoxyribonuclease VII small subunit [Pseudomonadota bacterium]
MTEADSKAKSAARPDFERSLEELETLVARMEKGDLSLEDSLAQFERGIALTRSCQQALREAEQKIDALAGPDGESLAPFGEREE